MSHAGKDVPLQGYFYIQRLYPGHDPLDNVLYSETKPRKKYFELNKNMLFFSNDKKSLEDIEDSLVLGDLYNPKADDYSKGVCCQRVTYQEFPVGKSLKTILAATKKNKKIKKQKACKHSSVDKSNPVTAPSKSKKKLNFEKLMPVAQANYCLELHIPDDSRWRICAGRKGKITKLQMKLTYYIMYGKHKKAGKKSSSLIDKFLSKIKPGKMIINSKWDWRNQKQWKAKCKTGFMQSPVNLKMRDIKQPHVDFNVSYHFNAVHTLIKKNFDEIIVAFINLAGVFKLKVGKTDLSFTPQYISFRFPAEHTIDGVRHDGEMLINFAEMSKDRKSAVSSGLSISIPLATNKKALSLTSLEALNIDFWKWEINRYGTYTPNKFTKKKLTKLNLAHIFTKALKNNPKWMLYFGSQTAPPCNENHYHLVLSQPLYISSCQFKIIRENTLTTSRPKEIHARMLQPLGDRSIYTFGRAKVGFEKKIENLVPKSYTKYMLANAYKKKDLKAQRNIARLKIKKRWQQDEDCSK